MNLAAEGRTRLALLLALLLLLYCWALPLFQELSKRLIMKNWHRIKRFLLENEEEFQDSAAEGRALMTLLLRLLLLMPCWLQWP